MSLSKIMPCLGVVISWHLVPLAAQPKAEVSSKSLTLSSSRTSTFSYAPRFSGRQHSWSGWVNLPEGTLGSFGFKADASISRDACSFDLSQVPAVKLITGAALRFKLKKDMSGACPVVPMIMVCKMPIEKEFAPWPESVWGAMDQSSNNLVDIPLQAQPEHEVPLAADSKLVKHVQASLKGKKPRLLILGFKTATERCVMYTLSHPVELELTFGK